MLDLNKVHAAAKIIRADGIHGIHSASDLIGYDAALAMLVLFIGNAHNSEGRWPDKEDTVTKVNEVLRKQGFEGLFHNFPQ